MKNFKNKKTLQIVLLVVIAVVTLGIGYAAISAVNLIINGNATASVNQENFKVHFTQAQSITGSTGASGTSSIDTQDDTKAMFDVTGLTKVGDYAEAVYTVRNDSNGVGAEISLNLSNTNNEYFKVTETILDNKLQAGEETTAKVKVEMIKTPITDTVSTTITATLTATPLEDAEATGGSSASKIAGDPESFSTDSWATIQKAVQNNNTSAYNVGDTKSVTINGNNYMVRIANKTTDQNCGNSDYSQTACGFVVEFAEIVEKRAMNSAGTNVGGWPATEMRTYLNGTFYNSLPSDLQAVIKSTRVISGHGCVSDFNRSTMTCGNPDNSGNNFTSTDNLYLLSGVEVYGIDDGQYHFYDTAYGTSHQLEYYSNNGVTYSTSSWNGTNLDKAIKQYNSSNTWWWLRPASSNGSAHFAAVPSTGDWNTDNAPNTDGVAPAFRIG